jgi:RNA-binding protein Nova
VQISKANEFYPGTPYSQDRVILISGTVDELLTALHLVITRTMVQPTNNGASLKSGDDDNRLQLQMLVHSKLCGTLIGKGGMTIRSFNNDSRASIHVSPPPTHPGLHERVVRIAGDVDELMRAVALIVTKLSENPDFFLLSDANLNYGFVYDRHNEAGRVLNTQYLNHNQMDGGGYGSDVTPLWTTPPPPYTSLHPVEVIIPIPDEQVGQVIGKEGSIVKQIKNLVNVDITISKRGDFLPGTCNRACQISGTADAVDLAQRLILQRLNRL